MLIYGNLRKNQMNLKLNLHLMNFSVLSMTCGFPNLRNTNWLRFVRASNQGQLEPSCHVCVLLPTKVLFLLATFVHVILLLIM